MLKAAAPYLLIAAGVASGIFLIDRQAYNRGVNAEASRWEALVEREYARQLEANREALRIAREEVERLRQQKEDLDAELERLAQEGAADPGAADVSLPARSVRRIDAVR